LGVLDCVSLLESEPQLLIGHGGRGRGLQFLYSPAHKVVLEAPEPLFQCRGGGGRGTAAGGGGGGGEAQARREGKGVLFTTAPAVHCRGHS